MDRANWTRRIIGFLAALAFLAAGGGVFWWLTQPEPSPEAQTRTDAPQTVQVATVEQAEEPPAFSQTGFVRAERAVELSFQVSGRVAEVSDAFEVGRQVAEGDTIARLETARIDAELSQAEADVQRAEAQLLEAENAYTRANTLEGRSVVSEAKLEDARARRAGARAGLVSARARLDTALQNRKDTTLSAPFDGIVARSDIAPGQVVQPGARLGRLIGAERAEIYVDFVQSRMAALERGGPVGMTARIREVGEAGTLLREGRIVNLAPELSEGVRLTTLIVEFPEPFTREPKVQIGQLVRVEIPLAPEKPLLAFPVDALRGGDTVWTVGEDGTLGREKVDVVHLGDERAYVREGALRSGTRLLATDLSVVREGMQVRLEGEERQLARGGESDSGGRK